MLKPPTTFPLTNSLAKKPKPKPPRKPAVPLPGYPVREGLDRPTIWQGGKPTKKFVPALTSLMLGRR